MPKIRIAVAMVAIGVVLGTSGVLQAQFSRARDPGPRGGSPGAGGPLPGLTPGQTQFFQVGLADFAEVEEVDDGLGPRFNAAGCGVCHGHPAIGGTSPARNPLVDVLTAFTGNTRPLPFITPGGPIREARFKYNPDGTRDGGVHNLFVISGHPDAAGCNITQEDFGAQLSRNNVIFRIPTPVFGAGLIEMIPDKAILANQAANASAKQSLGIGGRANRQRLFGQPFGVSGQANNNPNDGTISRFGWKAQVKSLLLFSGEAYNVEMGISSELFHTERDETTSCQFATVPNDVTETDPDDGVVKVSAIENFAFFQRFLAAPTPSSTMPGGSASIGRGRSKFTEVGCAYCHTPKLKTGNSTVAALRYQDVNLHSDLLVHNMGSGLADDIVQGDAGPDEFRTAPLWGLGQRLFFLHDGRATDLVEAIQAHRSAGTSKYAPSEANSVVDRYNLLRESDKQDILNFLRSL